MYKILISIPDPILKGGATRSMISICKLLEMSGDFEILSTSDRNEMFERLVEQAKPDVFLSYNNGETHLYQRKVAREHGSKIVYGLRNCHTSLGQEKMDGCLCSSEFVRRCYWGKEYRQSTNLPLPMIESEIIPREYSASRPYVTMVNPMRRKGLFLLEAILEELWEKRGRLDIWVKVVESTGTGKDISLKWFRYPCLYVMPLTQVPSDIYRDTNLTIIPSIWEEPACRVLVESMMNGIPVAYSDRGGMREVANGGGMCIRIPYNVSENTQVKDLMDMRECAKRWVDWIVICWDNKEYYLAESVNGLNACQMYLERNVAPRYVNYFKSVINGDKEMLDGKMGGEETGKLCMAD